jgi:hypothetical protein
VRTRSIITRHAKLTPASRRLTPLEVAQLWFRRGRDFVTEIHLQYPDFPQPAPDGLYLVAAVESWFEKFHDIGLGMSSISAEDELAQAMAAANGRRFN